METSQFYTRNPSPALQVNRQDGKDVARRDTQVRSRQGAVRRSDLYYDQSRDQSRSDSSSTPSRNPRVPRPSYTLDEFERSRSNSYAPTRSHDFQLQEHDSQEGAIVPVAAFEPPFCIAPRRTPSFPTRHGQAPCPLEAQTAHIPLPDIPIPPPEPVRRLLVREVTEAVMRQDQVQTAGRSREATPRGNREQGQTARSSGEATPREEASKGADDSSDREFDGHALEASISSLDSDYHYAPLLLDKKHESKQSKSPFDRDD